MKDQLDSLFQNFSPDPKSSSSPSAQKAIFLARRLQERAGQLQSGAERRQQAELDRMLQTPSDKATLAQMTDQAFRTQDPPGPWSIWFTSWTCKGCRDSSARWTGR